MTGAQATVLMKRMKGEYDMTEPNSDGICGCDSSFAEDEESGTTIELYVRQ